jgi:purine-binding chemotaxis protein CheW
MSDSQEILNVRADQLMPTDETAKLLLQKRAKQFSVKKIENKKEENHFSYIKFRLGPSEFYGISFEKIKEVIHDVHITQVPFVPNYIDGIINHRGLLLSVVNLKKYFELASNEIKNENKNNEIIIVSSNEITLGLYVTNIEGSGSYQLIQLDSLPIRASKIKPEYIVGVHQGRVAILDIEAVITDVVNQLKKSSKGG